MKKLTLCSFFGLVGVLGLAMLLAVHPATVQAQQTADDCGVCGGGPSCNMCHNACVHIFLGYDDNGNPIYGPDCISCGGGQCFPIIGELKPNQLKTKNAELASKGLYVAPAKGRNGYVVLKTAARYAKMPHATPGSVEFSKWLTAYVAKYPCPKKQAKTGL